MSGRSDEADEDAGPRWFGDVHCYPASVNMIGCRSLAAGMLRFWVQSSDLETSVSTVLSRSAERCVTRRHRMLFRVHPVSRASSDSRVQPVTL